MPTVASSIPFVAFAPDSKTVISAGDRVRIWDADTGGELRISAECLKFCSIAALRPDGKSLISGSRDGMIAWDLTTMKMLHSITPPADYPLALALSPDGKTLVAVTAHLKGGAKAGQENLRFWNVDSGKEISLSGKGSYGEQMAYTYGLHMAYSPDGRRFAAVQFFAKGTIRIWDTNTWDVCVDLQPTPETGKPRSVLLFSPDGKVLAADDGDNTIWLWDIQSGKPIRPLRGHQGSIRTAAFSPDGKSLLSGGDDDTLRLWDVATGETLHELVGHSSDVVAAAFSRDGKRMASASQDTTILIWDVPGLAKLVRPPPPPLTEEELLCLWTDLGSEEQIARQRAIRRFMTAPKAAVSFLKKRLKPDLPLDKRLAHLLNDLDDDSFAVREKASQELARMAKSIGPQLRRVLAEDLSPEKRRRVKALVDTLPLPRPQRPFRGIAEEERRLLNVIVLLDRMGTPDALDLMQYLARSSELSALLADSSVREREVYEAKAVLARRANHPSKP